MNSTDIMDKFDDLLAITRNSYDAFVKTTEALLKSQRPLALAVDEETAPADALQMDQALLAAAPVAAVPRHTPFHPLQDAGHRFLLAEDGLYVEVRRPWIHFIQRLAEHRAVAIPYGPLKNKCELAFGTIGSALPQLKEFAAGAKVVAPVEAAAALLWNHRERSWRIEYPATVGEATANHISYRTVEPGEDESLAIDVHSHGHLDAFFSETDNEDDRGSVKISAVFGNLAQPMPTVAFRLCVLGLYIPIPVPADKIFG